MTVFDGGFVLDGGDALRAAFIRAPDIATEEMLAAVWEAELLIQRETQEETPSGASGGSGLRATISAREPRVLADNVIGEVGSSAAHAVPVELGTKPHMPPVQPLVDYALHKLGVPAEEAEAVGMRIAWKIKAHGTKGAFMFKKGFDRGRDQVGRILAKGAARTVERIAREGR